MIGLGKKYVIRKADGSPVHEDADYFVLRLDTDPVARAAARLYAEQCGDDDLKRDLLTTIGLYDRIGRSKT